MGNACDGMEWLALGRGGTQAAVEAPATVNSPETGYDLEAALRTVCVAGVVDEAIASLGSGAKLTFGSLSVLSRHELPIIESITGGARILTFGTVSVEWGDPPITAVVSLGRFLRSPGRIRVLAGTGGRRPLRA